MSSYKVVNDNSNKNFQAFSIISYTNLKKKDFLGVHTLTIQVSIIYSFKHIVMLYSLQYVDDNNIFHTLLI